MNKPLKTVPVKIAPHPGAECVGPRLYHLRTFKPLLKYDPVCRRIWASLDERERLNFHKATCLNQMNRHIYETMQTITRKLQEAGIRR